MLTVSYGRAKKRGSTYVLHAETLVVGTFPSCESTTNIPCEGARAG